MAEVTPVEVQEKLDNIEYPASKAQLIKYAKEHGEKNEEVIEILNQIPDKEYGSPVEVDQAVGEII